MMKSKLIGLLLIVFACLLQSGRAKAADAPDVATCADEINRSKGAAREKTFDTDQANVELAKADCEETNVYCVDASGYPLPSEQRDPQLKTGQSLIVKLFGPKSCEGVLTVGTDVKQRDIRLFREEPTTDSTKKRETSSPLEVELLAKVTAKTGATTESVTVVVSRVDVQLSLQGIRLGVTPPRYYLDVGLLVSFTPGFQRVSTSRAPGSTETFIREERTIHPSAGVTINYFPLGQYAVPRFTDYHGIGFQAGIGGDLTRLDDEFYMGLIWEPIPGAGISGGLALMAMEKLQPDYPEGALVNPNDVPKDNFLGARFYFGVCLNTQVFQSVLQLGGKALVPNN